MALEKFTKQKDFLGGGKLGYLEFKERWISFETGSIGESLGCQKEPKWIDKDTKYTTIAVYP